MKCLCDVSGEGLYQVLETVESGFLAADDFDANGDVSLQEPATTDPRVFAQLVYDTHA